MTRGGWNYAEVWEAVSDRFPDAPALRHADRVVSWREFDRRADGLSAALRDAGLVRQDKVALYMRNRPEYLESVFGVFKAALVPVNTNYRYTAEELTYLFRDSDSAAVVFDEEFTDRCADIRATLPQVRIWIRVGDVSSCPTWAVAYDTAAMSADQRVAPTGGRSGDDLFLLYTGGTTGMPKGVMWRQDDLFRMLEASRGSWAEGEADADRWAARLNRPGDVALPAAPLMHGAAFWFSVPVLSRGGAIVTLTGASFDAVELLDAIERFDVRTASVVGDAFVRPIVQALEDCPDRWDLSGLKAVASSGAILSAACKARLLDLAPGVAVIDALGSSESGRLAASVTTRSDGGASPFALVAESRVIDEEGEDVVPGSGVAGRLVVSGHLPLGYYKDEEKTAATFIEMDGRRFVVSGDWATVAADGTIELLGRGSSMINTAGEKVYPEEVEQVLKQLPSVRDAAVVGVPDERFTQAVVAIVELVPGHELDPAALVAHAKQHLASYKAPRRVFVLDSIRRGPNGKLNHRWLTEVAERCIAEERAAVE